MIKEFCTLAKIDKDIEKILLSYPKDEELKLKMREAVKAQDRERIVELATQSQSLYGSLYPLVLFSYSLDITKTFSPSEKLLIDTLSDFPIWLSNFKRDYGYTGMANLPWLSRHITGTLMRLGRLQAEVTVSELIGKEKILSLHIPQGESLSPEKVDASLALIKKQFPEFDKAYCFSWLLDPALEQVLERGSNIISFQKRFSIFPIPSDNGKQTFERVFFTGATIDDVINFTPVTKLQMNIQQAVKDGISFSQFGGLINL